MGGIGGMGGVNGNGGGGGVILRGEVWWRAFGAEWGREVRHAGVPRACGRVREGGATRGWVHDSAGLRNFLGS